MRWAVLLTLAARADGAVAAHATGMLAPVSMPVSVPTPTVVRRRAGFARATTAALLVLVTSGCGGIGQPAPYDTQGIDGLVVPTPTPDPDDFAATIDNAWLPLTPGATWHYEVKESGATVGSIETEVLPDTTDVAGLVATAVRTTTGTEGETVTSIRFYAQDDSGNVWWVGEDIGEGPDGVSWRAGEAGAQAGLAMPADPRLGDGWRSYVVAGLPDASARVVDQGADMVQTRRQQGSDADASTLESYTSGVGLVSVEAAASSRTAVLVDHQPG